MLRFGPAVKAKPRIDGLTVIGVSGEGAVFALSNGMTTTTNGTIEINDALEIAVGTPEGNRVAVRISRVN